jgi:hypothetical protein
MGTQQADAEDFILYGVVTATFRVLALFAVMMCYSYSKIKSVIIIIVAPTSEYPINRLSIPNPV